MLTNYINPVAFKIGPFSIHYYAIAIVTGIICAMAMAIHEGKKVGITEDDVYDYVILGLPIAFIGARLYYVIFEWSYYKEHLDQIIAIWNGGIAIYGGLIFGLLYLWLFCKKRQINLLKYLDIIVPGVLLAQGIGRWGNFFNHEAFGSAVSYDFLANLHLPKFIIENMKINGIYHQPTFLYESLWDILGVILIVIYRKIKKPRYQGEILAIYLIWYSFGRFFIEGLRMDSLYIFGIIRVSQLVSVVLFITGITLLIWINNKKFKKYL